MPDSITEAEYLTLAEACKRIPGRPTINTVRRWGLRGVGGVRLELWKCGGKPITSVAAIDRFIAATTAQSAQGEPTPTTTTSTAHEIAEEKLGAILGVK